MVAGKRISAQFDYFCSKSEDYYNDQKELYSDQVFLEKNTLYFGREGKYREKFSKITDIEIDLNESSFVIRTKKRTYTVESVKQISFLTQFEKKWSKHQQKKARDQDEEELDSNELPAARAAGTKRSYGRSGNYNRTGAAAKRRMERFLSHNRENWSDDEKQVEVEVEEEPPLKEEEQQDEDDDQDTAGVSKTDDDDEKEEDYQGHDEQDDDDATEVKDDGESMPFDDSDEDPDTPFQMKTKKKQLKKRSTSHFTEDDSDDDNIFVTPPLTTPKASRVVSPPNSAVFTNDDDEDEIELENAEQDDGAHSQTGTPKDHRSISSFFTAARTTVKPKNDTKKEEAKAQVEPKETIQQAKPLKRNTTWLEADKTTPPLSSPKKPHSKFFHRRSSDIEDDIQTVDSDEEKPKVIKRPKLDSRKTPSKAENALNLASFAAGSAKTNKQSFSSMARPKRITFDKPPKSIWKGLRNLGNTCYMNSSLQLLFTLPDFINGLSKKGKGPLATSIVSAFNELRDTSSEAMVVSPRCVKSAIDDLTTQFEGYEQRDAHEFVSDLVDRVHDEMKEDQTDGALPTDDFFHMDVRQCLQCDSCGHQR